jgi:hypothetical protein
LLPFFLPHKSRVNQGTPSSFLPTLRKIFEKKLQHSECLPAGTRIGTWSGRNSYWDLDSRVPGQAGSGRVSGQSGSGRVSGLTGSGRVSGQTGTRCETRTGTRCGAPTETRTGTRSGTSYGDSKRD